jgi:4-amino-4-deoxy-L-arabinose transferase-like glycosyltransferase
MYAMRSNVLAFAVGCSALATIFGLRAHHQRNDGRGLHSDDGSVQREIDCDPCRGPRALVGTWFLPRGGPYVFGLETLGDASATLELDGKMVLSSRGATRGEPARVRLVFPAGPLAVRLTHAGDGAMRLYWLPPGRRGDFEYVPPETLRPVAPADAGPMPADLAYRDDAWALSASLLVLVGLAAFLWRRRLLAWRPHRIDVGLVILVFAAAASLRLWGLGAFGQTWDEDVYWSSGRNYLENLLHFDFRQRMWRWNFEHPPVAKYLLGLGALWHDGYGPARALVALVGSATCVLIYLIGRELYSRRVGAGAALLYVFLPPAVAHSQISGLETPSTFCCTLAMLWFVRRRYLAAGLAGGLAAATRFIGGLVFLGMALAALAEPPRGRRAWTRLALSPLVGVMTLVAVWPRLWIEGPRAGLLASLHRLNVQHAPEWFLGRAIVTPVPKSYFLIYFAACVTPAILLGLCCVALRRSRATAICLGFFAAPFALTFSPVIQSGVRYLLPALPPAALLAAGGLDAAASRLWPRRGSLVALGAAAATSLFSCLSVRPYYLDYYNALFGGPRAALRSRRFVFGWWGEGVASAVGWFNAHAPPGARVFYDLYPNHVVWLRADVEPTLRLDDAEYVLLNHFQFRQPPSRFEEIFREEVAPGAPLAAVYRRRFAVNREP